GPPRFVAWDAEAPCEAVLAPGPESPLVDAGDPEGRDRDGSRADIGATGGADGIALVVDVDADGTPAEQDCDDLDPTVYPEAEEIPYDGIDQDCDGSDLTDVDGDGYDALAAGGDDCDDEDPEVHPGAV